MNKKIRQMTYYIIEKNYVGPNQGTDEYIDADTISICTRPARKNMSGEPCTDGWCGTTNDWAVSAYGVHHSIEAARAEIHTLAGAGGVRQIDLDTDDLDTADDLEYEMECNGLIELYKPGRYEPLSIEATAAWIDPSDIRADMDIEQLYEENANTEGFTLHRGLVDWLQEQRDDLQAAAREE